MTFIFYISPLIKYPRQLSLYGGKHTCGITKTETLKPTHPSASSIQTINYKEGHPAAVKTVNECSK